MTIEIKKPLEAEEVKALLHENEGVLLVLNEQEFKRDYIITLQKELPNYLVSETRETNKLFISPSIATDTILKYLNEFYNAIELFDKTAHNLMYLMAEAFNIDLNNPREIHDLKRNRSDKQRGNLNNEWRYHFHGDACSFTNTITNQFLDVKINKGLEYGKLDVYYLMKFIQSTPSFKELSIILNDKSINMGKVIEVLKMHDYIIPLSNEINNEFIINRNKKPY